MRARIACRKSLIVPVSAAVGLAVSLLVAGCGQGPAPAGTTVSLEQTSNAVVTAQSTTSSQTAASSTSTIAVAPTVESVFDSLAQASQPMTIFVPTFLPEGAILADTWLPVVESPDPASYGGPPVGNPQVVGAGADAEIQVVFQSGDGWLAILENFRGDLGDVTGTPVGSVAGNPATLYDINGGQLVQWSQDGLWYGVFGRGVGRDEVVAVALGMQPAPVNAR